MDYNNVIFIDRCFADAGDVCTALIEKECSGCKFRKSMSEYIDGICANKKTDFDKTV